MCERISCYVEGIGTNELRIAGSSSKEVYSRKEGQVGTTYKVQFSRRTWHHMKIRERIGSTLGINQKCAPHERSSCGPKFAERSLQETLHQERCARRVGWNLAENLYKLQNLDEATLLLSY